MSDIRMETLTRGQKKMLLGQTQMAFLPLALNRVDDAEAFRRIDELADYAGRLEFLLSEELNLTRFELTFVLISVAYSVMYGTGE